MGHLAARVSFYLTACAYPGDFDQRPRRKPTEAVTALEFALGACLRAMALFLAILSVSFGAVPSARAEASAPLCEAAFFGSLPVLKELARLNVAASQAYAAGKTELAVTLYQIYRKRSDQAKADGVELRGLKAMLDEVEANENKKSLDEEARTERTRAFEDVRIIDGRRAIFQPIAPKKFMMGEVRKKVETEITKPFEMAATQTTQVVWRKIVEQARLKLPGKYDALNPDPSKFKGDLNPVEKVSWDDIQIWLSALNELAAEGDPVVNDVMPDHKPGQIYRLPTEAEWEFVVRGRGQYNGAYHFGKRESQLDEYGWYIKNSGNQPHPVAQKKPLIAGGKEFYDMHGNVLEWVHDWYQSNPPGGTDPQGPEHGPGRILRGGSWGSSAPSLISNARSYEKPGQRDELHGFRLVRTTP